MKKMIFFAILFCAVAQASQASSSLDLSEKRKAIFQKMNSCGQAIYSDATWFVTSLPNAANGIGHIRIQSLLDDAKSLDLPAGDTVVDVKVRNGNVYVLTETTFESWNIESARMLFKLASHPYVNKTSHWGKKAMGFVLSGDKAILAHGTAGISVLDIKKGITEKIIAMPTVSSAQDIDLLNPDSAVIAVDNASEAEFRGLYLFDLKTLSITKQIKIDNAYPLSIRVLPNNRLLIGYINAVWKFDLSKAVAGKEATPNRRSWRFPGLDNVDIRGKIFYDEKYLYSCFSWVDSYNAQGFGMTAPHPLVFSLDELKLNP